MGGKSKCLFHSILESLQLTDMLPLHYSLVLRLHGDVICTVVMITMWVYYNQGGLRRGRIQGPQTPFHCYMSKCLVVTGEGWPTYLHILLGSGSRNRTNLHHSTDGMMTAPGNYYSINTCCLNWTSHARVPEPHSVCMGPPMMPILLLPWALVSRIW